MYQFPQYEVRVGNDLGDPDFWNSRLRSLDLRIHGQELIEKDWQDAVRELTDNGIRRIDDALAPLLSQLEEDAQLGALFVSASSTTLTIGTGVKTVAVTATNARRFAPAAWVALTTTAAPYAVMIGPVVSYDRQTGTLTLNVERAYDGGGATTRSGWSIAATAHIDYLADRVQRAAGGGLVSTNVEAALREILSLTAPRTRSISPGTGLTGGGDLSSDRTISLDLAYSDARYVKVQTFDGHGHSFGSLSGRPTTIAGYGILDAYTKAQVDTSLANKSSLGHGHAIGDVAGLQGALDAKLDDSQASVFGLSLLDDANAAAARTTLGLGAMATKGSVATGDLDNAAATNAKLGTMATATLKGRSSAGTGAPEDLTAVQVKAILGVAIADVAGLQTALDAKAAASSLGSLAGKSSVATGDLDTSAVTNVKLANMATGRIKGRSSAGTGDAEDLTAVQVKAILGVAIADVAGLQTALDGKQASLGFTPEDVAKRGAANGYATLDSNGRVPSSQLPADGSYKGTYNAATNTPAITSGSGTQGDFYIVATAGTVSADSVGAVNAGDQLRRGPSTWQRVPTYNAVSSVAGKTGTVTIAVDDLTDASTVGKDVLKSASAAAGRTALGLGAMATKGSVATGDIDNAAATNAKLANMATATLKGRATAGTGVPEDLTAVQVKAILGVAIADVAGLQTALDAKAATSSLGALAGKSSVATGDLDNAAASNAKLASMATSTLKGRASAGTGAPEDLTAVQVKAILGVAIADVAGLQTALDDKAATSAFSALSASALTTGTVPDARMSGTYTDIGIKRSGSTPLMLAASGTGSNTGRVLDQVATFKSGTNPITGAIVFTLPAISTNVLMSLRLRGYNHAGAPASSFDVTISGSCSSAGAWTNTALVQSGAVEPLVRFGRLASTSQGVVIVGDEATVWRAPHIAIVEALVSGGGVTDTFCANWTSDILTSLAGYDGFVSPADPRADALTARIDAKLNASAASTFGLSLLDDANAAAARTTLGLGDVATTNASSYAPASHVGTGGTAHLNATTTVAGFMSAPDKTKLNAIEAGANAYTHPSGDGNLHVPATGTGNSGKVLRAGGTAGSMTWDWVAFSELAGKPTTLAGYGIADAYTEGEINSLLAGKQASLGYTAENTSQKGVANGYCGLDGAGKVPQAFLPAIALTNPTVVMSQAAMLALTAEPGDLAIRGDANETYILAASPASTLANWIKLLTPTDAVSSVAGRTGAITLAMTDVADISAFARTVLVKTTSSGWRTSLGLGALSLKDTAQADDISDAGTIGKSLLRNEAVADARTTLGLGSLALKSSVVTADLGDSAATNAKLANMATARLKGRVSAGTGVPEDLTAAQARQVLGLVSPIVDSVYAEYRTWAALTAVIPIDDTKPQNTEGTQILSASITPKSTTSRLRVRAICCGGGAGGGAAMALFRSGSADALAASVLSLNDYYGGTAVTTYGSMVLEYEMVSGTTSAITFSVRAGPVSGTLGINGNAAGRLFGDAAVATLVIEESL